MPLEGMLLSVSYECELTKAGQIIGCIVNLRSVLLRLLPTRGKFLQIHLSLKTQDGKISIRIDEYRQIDESFAHRVIEGKKRGELVERSNLVCNHLVFRLRIGCHQWQ